jgi:hypothetical protein
MLQSILQHLHKLSNDLKLYAEKRVELLSLQATEKASALSASLITVIIVSAFLIISLVFLLNALVVWLNIWVAFPAFGQLIVGTIFFIVFLLLLKSKKTIDISLKREIERKILQNGEKLTLIEKIKDHEQQ